MDTRAGRLTGLGFTSTLIELTSEGWRSLQRPRDV
jgi:hypothetical protein